MSRPQKGHTVADVLHHMYLADANSVRFPDTLAARLQMDVHHLRALYDKPAPDPQSSRFMGTVRAIAAEVGCDAEVLAELLRTWTPALAQGEESIG